MAEKEKQFEEEYKPSRRRFFRPKLFYSIPDVVVIVVLVFYGPSKHFMSFRARSVNLATLFLCNLNQLNFFNWWNLISFLCSVQTNAYQNTENMLPFWRCVYYTGLEF